MTDWYFWSDTNLALFRDQLEDWGIDYEQVDFATIRVLEDKYEDMVTEMARDLGADKDGPNGGNN